MDTLSLYYFSELAKDLHITRTANRLFISQQTLSNHIMRLEEYYGVKLLNRKPSLSLTYAGEYVLSFAETMNRENANLMDILADIQKQKRGLILFGASTLRMSASLPDILPEFSSRYPNVEIRITDMNSKRLEQLILSGDLDLAIVISGGEHPSIEEKPLMSDQIYLCAADTLLRKYYGDGTEDLKRKPETWRM
ncbi:LysR family transcriptional regulator [Enterocloster bolteae]|nr:LysR family transcriptional regulator [Enterocloster bolteae]